MTTNPPLDPNTSNAAAIATVAQTAAGVTQHDLKDGSQLTVIPSAVGAPSQIVTRQEDDPMDHVRRIATHQRVDSFIAYVNRWKAEGQTSVTFDEAQQRIGAVIDGDNHLEFDGGYADHVARFRPLATPEWSVLAPLINEWATRDAFSEAMLILARNGNIRLHADQDSEIVGDFPSSADVLALAQHFNVSRNVQFEEGEKHADGSRTLRFVEENKATGGKAGDLDIPAAILFGIDLFRDSGEYMIDCTFRWRIRGEGALEIRLDFPQLPLLIADVYRDYVDHIERELKDVPVITGALSIPTP